MGVKQVNCNADDGRVRVMCPACGAGGGHNINSYQPKCHKCESMMLPASNKKVECGWAEFKDYFNGELQETIRKNREKRNARVKRNDTVSGECKH